MMRYMVVKRKRSGRRALIVLSCFLAIGMVCLSGHSLAWLQSGPTPLIFSDKASFNPRKGALTIKGENFQKGAALTLTNAAGPISFSNAKIKGETKIVIKSVAEADIADGVDVKVTNPNGSFVTAHIAVSVADDTRLTVSDVKTIIAQAVAQAEASGLRASIAVVDAEGNILANFTMNGTPKNTVVGIGTRCFGDFPNCGLEGVKVPSCSAAISKAVTGSFLSSGGHAFSTRTASFIVQEHFPPGVNFQPGGPLFGVQFSQFLCSDVNARAPLGLSADAGGIPLYKNGLKVGGIGIEGDGVYSLDPDPTDKDQPVEELVAVAASRGFEAPDAITGDKIVVNGIRFPYVNTPMPASLTLKAFDNLPGSLIGPCTNAPDPAHPDRLPLAPATVLPAQPSRFRVITLPGADPDKVPPGRVDNRFFPFKNGSVLTANDVLQVITQAAAQAFITRAAIRQPLNSPTQVNMTVVDVDGTILGIFSTIDAPIFGFDVSAQKARTAAFFSNPVAGRTLRQAGLGRYVDAAAADGLGLDGTVAFSDRAGGFLSRPFFPDGIDETEHGPFSVPIEDFSPFHDGLQLDLVLDEYYGNILRFLNSNGQDVGSLLNAVAFPCTSFFNLGNGNQIFPGSVPLYKNGKLAGGIGLSGDGVDQDDIIATMGSTGFESPPEMRADRVFVRGIRLPFVKFPRHPNR